MQIDNTQYKLLCDALEDAFNYNELKAMLQFALGQELESITRAANMKTDIFELVGYYNRRNQVDLLLQGARRFNPTNGKLHLVAQLLGKATQVTTHIADSVTEVRGAELEKLVRRQVPKLNAKKMRQQMMRVEGQMCVVERRLPSGRGEARGSGFLIGPDVVLTNYHVVDGYLQGTQAQNLQVRFDALLQEDGVREPEEGVVVGVDTIPIAQPYTPNDVGNVSQPPAAAELDFAILLLADEAGKAQVGGAASSMQTDVKRGWMQMPDPDPVFEDGDPLIIYQFPGGRELMMAIDTEAVVGTVWDGMRLRYRNNTEPGSSGSPVFDFGWNLVALHHAGAPGPEPAPYNQGIPIAKIKAYLEAEQMMHLLGGD